MRQRVAKLVAALLLIVGGVAVTAAIAAASDGEQTVSTDSNSWE